MNACADVGGMWEDGDQIDDNAHAGKPLTRTYRVRNRGTTTLSKPCVVDPKFGTDCLECDVPEDGLIPPGKACVCKVTSNVSFFWSFSQYSVFARYTFPHDTCCLGSACPFMKKNRRVCGSRPTFVSVLYGHGFP